MKKVLILSLIVICFTPFSFGQEKKFQVSFSGGLGYFFKYGAEKDYVPAMNDFPVTPSHWPACLGLSFSYFFKKNLAFGLSGRYFLSSKVNLIDPSDQDKVEYKTAKHFSLTADFIWQFSIRNFFPYLVLGGGMDSIFANTEKLVSSYGYEIEFAAPEKKLDPLLNGGVGMRIFMASNLGIEMDFRYVLIFADPHKISSINMMAGVFYQF